MCRWGCSENVQSFKCKFCGTNYCKACRRGDFHGEMFAPDTCRVCNQPKCQGERIRPPKIEKSSKSSLTSTTKDVPSRASDRKPCASSCQVTNSTRRRGSVQSVQSVQADNARLKHARLVARRASKP